jgi:class 3 adenylate cyclase/predicted ATPase/DNA-binding winged helix-turn-helix (wHTH) protein
MRYVFGDYTLDMDHYELCRAGARVPLEPRVFNLLAYLVQHPGRTVLKEELQEQLWPKQFVAETSLANAVAQARKALHDTGQPSRYIETRRRRGYCFIAPVTLQPPGPGAGLPPSALAAPGAVEAPAQADAGSSPPAVPPDPSSIPQPEKTSAVVPRAPSPGTLAAERRQVTVLFCDLVESTALSGQLDPEDLREVLQVYLEACAEVVARFGGNLDKFVGDGALVCFGYPQAHDDDPQRAVRTGLGIMEAMARVNTRLVQTWGVQLAVRLGIHTGLVVAGDLRVDATRESQAIVGETPNIAARLQELAAPNTVVCSAATVRLVEGYFTLEALGPQVLKGVAVPMSVYRVLGESAAQTRLDVAATRGLTPLMGREPEVALLQERWTAAKDGRGQVVLLSGEGGIGKSRLVQAFTAQLTGEAYTRMGYHCSPYYQQSAFYPVVDHLQDLLQLHTDGLPEEKLLKLETVLGSYDFALEEVVPLVATLLGLSPSKRYPPLTMTPQHQKQKTLETLLAWLLKDAERQPVCVVMEDLHWGDPSTLEWLSLLIEQVPTARVLLLLLFRPEFQPPWTGRSYITPLALSRLSTIQTAGMIGHVTGGKRLPAEVVQHLVVTTDGVPLFIEELTKLVLESGLVTEREAQYELVGPLSQLTIPMTLHDSLMARLDRLGKVKQVAQLGATLGREFSYALLQAVLPLEEVALQHGLSQLVEAELLYRRGLPPRASYVFKHALIQEAAYQSLLKGTRRQYHQQIAQVLEARFPKTVATQPELLAHHYTEAGLSAQAIPYWQRAGQQAIEHSANLEAINHLTKGLEVLKTRPDTRERVQQELDIQITLGQAFMTVKGFGAPEVELAYTRARALCQQVQDTPRLFLVLIGLWRCYQNRGQLQTARELGEQCLALAHQLHDPTLLLWGHWALGTTLWFLGECAPAAAHLVQGTAFYEHHQPQPRYGGTNPGVLCLSYAALALWALGYPDQALQRSQEALTRARELAHPFSLTQALFLAALLHQFRREVDAARTYTEASMALARAQESEQCVALCTIYGGWILAMQGHGDEGIAELQQGINAWQATGAAIALYYLILLAQAYGESGRTADGLGVLVEARTRVDHDEDRLYEAEVYRLQGELLLRPAVGDEHQAEACFQHALAVARRQQARSWELRAAVSLSRLWQRQGKRDAARALLSPIYGWFTEGFDTADLQEAKALLEEGER